jgi:hypothetical protein
MNLYRIEVREGVKVVGVTADGVPTTVLPGEHLVHPLPAKVAPAPPLCRFVGADAAGRDVHVPLAVFRRLQLVGLEPFTPEASHRNGVQSSALASDAKS